MKTLIFSVAGFVLWMASLCAAQSTQVLQPPADGGTRGEMLISILIPSIPNAPFTAVVNTEWVRQVSGGGTIKLKNHRAIARDSAGRIFQERRGLVPDDGKHESPLTQIEISDPVAHELYICILQELTCQVEVLSRPERHNFSPVEGAINTPDMDDLGVQTIGGLQAVGRRQMTVIPIGTIGNDSPLLAKREFWYSPALGLNLFSTREDPRFGTQKFVLSDIVLAEPDPKMFQLPPGLKIIDLRHPPTQTSGAIHQQSHQ